MIAHNKALNEIDHTCLLSDTIEGVLLNRTGWALSLSDIEQDKKVGMCIAYSEGDFES